MKDFEQFLTGVVDGQPIAGLGLEKSGMLDEGERDLVEKDS